MSTSIIFSICLFHMLAVISPGPGFLVAVKSAISSSRSAGYFTALGIALADLLILGSLILFSYSVSLLSNYFFVLLKVSGALYLIFIGIKTITSANKKLKVDFKSHKISAFQGFKDGFFTTLLNPKAIIYFMSISSQFVSMNKFWIFNIFILIGLISFLWFGFVSYVFSNSYLKIKFFKFINLEKYLGFGLVLIGFLILARN